jgi:hypothetical protein
MNKKADADDWIMLFAYLVVLGLIAFSVGFIVAVYFNQYYEFRQIDSDLLNYRIKKCLSEKDINLNQESDKFGEEIFQKCNINEEVVKKHFLLIIRQDNELKYSWKGDEALCHLERDHPTLPKCTQSTITKNQKQITIITGGYNQN